jgi:hypothetical protein
MNLNKRPANSPKPAALAVNTKRSPTSASHFTQISSPPTGLSNRFAI